MSLFSPYTDAVAMDVSDENDVHALTGLLKLYFRELSEPAFTDSLYPRFIEAGSTFGFGQKRTPFLAPAAASCCSPSSP